MDTRSRRRAVQKLVSLAPVVLTLRSGSVAGVVMAAESCVSIKAFATVNRTTGMINSQEIPIVDGDYCFGATEISMCQPGDSPRIARDVGFGEPVQQDLMGNFICPPTNLRSSRVAILSSASATSLVG